MSYIKNFKDLKINKNVYIDIVIMYYLLANFITKYELSSLIV